MRVVLAALIALGLTPPLHAQTVDGAAAMGALFSTRRVKVLVFNLPMLSDQDKFVLSEISKQQKYYGAVAISPDEGLMAEATLAAANYHAIPPAEAAARAACDRARRPASARCVIAAHVLPPDHTPRALQLSVDATQAFRDNWAARGRRPWRSRMRRGNGRWRGARVPPRLQPPIVTARPQQPGAAIAGL